MDETITNAAQQELNAEQIAPAETAALDTPAEEVTPETASAPAENAAPENTNTVQQKRKKTAIILGAVLLVVIIAAIILTPSKFERVENKCIHIAGQAGTGKNYFTLDTCPDSYENMDETMRNLLLPDVQKRTLEAIKYANDELGFPGIYALMLKTPALMGRQSEENSKYKVSWYYHPDSGLEVMYQKK